MTGATIGTPQRRRPRVWPWLIAAVVVIGLAVAAWFIAEAIARDMVEKTIRQQVITRLSLPVDQKIDVDVEGTVIPQLIAGSLDDVTVSSDDVPLGEAVGDVTVQVTGLPIRETAPIGSGSGTVSLGIDAVRTLLGNVDGLPDVDIALAAPAVTASTELSVLGLQVPVSLALTPSAQDGELVLTPDSVEVAGARIEAADVRKRFGSAADALTRDRSICIAAYLPKGLHLESVKVEGQEIVSGFSVDPAIASDPSMQANGSCA